MRSRQHELSESALSLMYVKKECPSAYISDAKSAHSLSMQSPSFVSSAIVSTGNVSTAFVRSLLNHFMKRFCSHDSPSQSGLLPSGKRNSPNRLSK